MTLKKPNWNDRVDRQLYYDLFYRKTEQLTEQEEEFCKTMYYYEKYACDSEEQDEIYN